MKLFYMGRRVNGHYDSFKARVRRFWFYTKVTGGAIAVGGIIFMAGALFASSNTVTAQNIVVPVPTDSPVLDRIADCESGNGTRGSATQFKNGQVIMRANSNGTIDVGRYQVNLTYWGAQATKLGLDLTKESDNKKMAEWIYANKGTGDWSASQKCWSR